MLWAADAGSATMKFLSDSETPYFFQVRFERTDVYGTSVVDYRKTRCDYFDGSVLGAAPFGSVAELDELASYLWFAEGPGRLALLAMLHPQAFSLRTTLCHARVYTELGTAPGEDCERVELMQTDFEMDAGTGVVSMAPAKVVRAFPCRPP